MIPPENSDETEALDLASFRTDNLEDRELAAAYAAENERIRLDGEILGPVWVFGVIPFALVMMLLHVLLGSWVWKAVPAIFVVAYVGSALVRMGWLRRYRSDLPIYLPGHGALRGVRKRKLLLAGAALTVLLIVADMAWGLIHALLMECGHGCNLPF